MEVKTVLQGIPSDEQTQATLALLQILALTDKRFLDCHVGLPASSQRQKEVLK